MLKYPLLYLGHLILNKYWEFMHVAKFGFRITYSVSIVNLISKGWNYGRSNYGRDMSQQYEILLVMYLERIVSRHVKRLVPCRCSLITSIPDFLSEEVPRSMLLYPRKSFLYYPFSLSAGRHVRSISNCMPKARIS